MLNCIVEEARQQNVFSRENTLTDRVLLITPAASRGEQPIVLLSTERDAVVQSGRLWWVSQGTCLTESRVEAVPPLVRSRIVLWFHDMGS